jgi:type II secretory pathway pseudopilin PulG
MNSRNSDSNHLSEFRMKAPVQAAFTLLDLIVVLGLLVFLACTLAPTWAKSDNGNKAFQCLNNFRQLGAAWNMYAEENRGKLPPNRDGVYRPAWVGGWLDFNNGNTDNTNINLLVNRQMSPDTGHLGPYVASPSVFKCPGDRSQTRFGTAWLPRVRSVSMNNYVGELSLTWSGYRFSVNRRLSDIFQPAYLFVLLDERQESINDGCFYVDPDALWQLVDYPASYHNTCGSFVFADGHTELHRWLDRRTAPPVTAGNTLPMNINLPNNRDVLWLQMRATGRH